MARPRLNRPTDAELAILNVIWSSGPSTVSQVKQQLRGEGVSLAESSVLKLMQIMVAKDLLVREEKTRPQVYAPAGSKEETQRHLIGDLIRRAFGGSTVAMIRQAVALGTISDDETESLQKILAERTLVAADER